MFFIYVLYIYTDSHKTKNKINKKTKKKESNMFIQRDASDERKKQINRHFPLQAYKHNNQ